MVCGVKYCGGCNARYNRTAFFGQVEKACAEVDFQYVKPDVIYDHLIVICGCPSKCANISTIQVSGDTFKVADENQLEGLITKLKAR